MIIDITPKPKKNLYVEHEWFAWHPICIEKNKKRYWVWLIKVKRKKTCYPFVLFTVEKWLYDFIEIKTPLK